MSAGAAFLGQGNRLSAVLNFRLATILDPENPETHNNFAWTMVSVPEPALFSVSRALTSARKAVELKPTEWMYWNTLGVVAFRSGDWKAAAESLEKSMSLNDGGGAMDWFFMAMTRWHQGKPDLARDLFRKATDYYLKHNPGDRELAQLQSEAKNLLAQPAPNSDAKTRPRERDGELKETARKEANLLGSSP